jgi:transmembrane sensor
MDKKLLEKYFNNNCNDEEVNLVLTWFRDSSGTTEGKTLLHRIWEELPENDFDIKTDFDSILNNIHHGINVHQTKLMMDNAEGDLIKYNRRQYLIRIFRNAAAILLFPVFGLGLFFSFKYYSARSVQLSGNQAYNEIFSSVDAITKVTLPDGSFVWLNHSSSLCYPVTFNEKYRKVELKGEGFFEVAHNSELPLIVSVGEIQVVAYGTTFNVMAYPDDDKIETSLINGSVEIQKILPDGKASTFYKMNPTDYTIYNKNNNEILTNTISDNRYFSWKDGKLIFTSEPLEDVVKKLSRWFNVDIQIIDPKLNNFPLTATFVHESLPQVMELLAIVSPIKYYISKREKNSDGTFTKKKIIIDHR